jgi:transposase
MIRKKTLPRQQEFWVARASIKGGSGSNFYDRLAADLDDIGFGDFVRKECAPYYTASGPGRPPVDPEVYFKMLMVGFFEKLGSERGIATRCEDSLSIRRYLRYDLTEATPDHSSLTIIRQRLPKEVFAAVFTFSLRPLHKAGLIHAGAIGIDSSLIEANASLEKLIRREDGKSYSDYIAELAEAEGIDPTNKTAVAAFDRMRKGKKTSNEEWYSPNDADAKIGPRKDGAWDMIHKVENAVDLSSGAILSVEIQSAGKADSEGIAAHFETAAAMVDYTTAVLEKEEANRGEDTNKDDSDSPTGEEEDTPVRHAVADKGYHKNTELAELRAAGFEPVIAEPAGRKVPKDEKEAAAFEANRNNRRSEEGRTLLRMRAEKVERSFRHLLDHGGSRRTTLCGHANISKRMYIGAFAFNLAIYGWNVHGVGTLKQYLAGNRRNGWFCRSIFRIISACEVLRRAVVATFRQMVGNLNFGLPVFHEDTKPNINRLLTFVAWKSA